jgi:hypothetical protein
MAIESSSQQPEQEPIDFKPGGPLEHLGGMSAKFGDVEVHIIASVDDPEIGFITGLNGKNTAAVLHDIQAAIERAGFKSIEYRPDNEDGRAAARIRLFEMLKKKI